MDGAYLDEHGVHLRTARRAPSLAGHGAWKLRIEGGLTPVGSEGV
jgi:hypothetical protein